MHLSSEENQIDVCQDESHHDQPRSRHDKSATDDMRSSSTKPSPTRSALDPADVSQAHSKREVDSLAAASSQEATKSPNLVVAASRAKTCATKQFQKTRSFSAVEDTPDRSTTITDHLEVVDDAASNPSGALRDASYSRSDQLTRLKDKSDDKQPKDDESKNKLVASSSTLVGHSSKQLRVDSQSSCRDSTTQKASNRGGTLVMQFDYSADNQPMSLQLDLGQKSNSPIKIGRKNMNDSSGSDIRSEAEQSRSHMYNARPRLELDDRTATT